MTLLDANGKPTGEDGEDCTWMAEALNHWLSEPRTVAVIASQHIFDAEEYRRVRAGLVIGLSTGKPFKAEQLRALVLRMLQNRVVRIRLAADTLYREYGDYHGYLKMCRDYERVSAAWAKLRLMGKDPGPKPIDPREDPNPPRPPHDRREVMKGLQEIRLELEAKAESRIERPFE